MMSRITRIEADALEFAPDRVRSQLAAPSPLPRVVLYSLLALCVALLAWAIAGRLDIVAVADGKLVPQSFLKIVQPADSGIVREILVTEGDAVQEGQVLIRMDARLSEADSRALQAELNRKRLQLRRIDAELGGAPLKRKPEDPLELFAQVEAQFHARRQSYLDALGTEQAMLVRAQHDLKSAIETEDKLKQTAPILREQEKAWDQLAKEGFAGRLLVLDRQRSRIETEQDLRAQTQNVAGLQAGIAQSERRIAQITSNYRQQLQNERVETEAQYHKLQQDWDKQQHRHGLLELKAPQAGLVKDLATHTPGTVVAPGTILLTLVPSDEPLQAEIWIPNKDVGFVNAGQPVKIKLAAYPFQHYGMLDGVVRHVSLDASDRPNNENPLPARNGAVPLNYRALIALRSPQLERNGLNLRLTPGMQVSAEILLGTRSVLEYLLSPIQRIAHEAGRER
jgi:hemolysin D